MGKIFQRKIRPSFLGRIDLFYKAVTGQTFLASKGQIFYPRFSLFSLVLTRPRSSSFSPILSPYLSSSCQALLEFAERNLEIKRLLFSPVFLPSVRDKGN